MKQTIIALLNLSEIDTKIHHLIEEQEELPQINHNLKSEITTLQDTLTAKHADLAEAQNLKKDFTSSIQIKTEWILDRETRINDLKTQKEYQAAQKEITAAKKEIKEKENLLLELDPKIEKLTAEHAALTENNLPKIEELKNTIMENNKYLSSIETKVIELKKQQQEIAAAIPDQAALKHYHHILRKAVPALSRLDNSICTECGTRVLPQSINLLKVGKTMQYCTRCKRILYLEEMLLPDQSEAS